MPVDLAHGGDDAVGDRDVARPGGAPVPSTIVPLRMIRSAISATPVLRRPLLGRTTRDIVSRFGGDGPRSAYDSDRGTNMSDLEGRSYLVTGGASASGSPPHSDSWPMGTSVVAADVAERPDALDGPDDRLVFASLDVTDESAVADVVSFTVERFGRIDGVVTAAGVAGGGPPTTSRSRSGTASSR